MNILIETISGMKNITENLNQILIKQFKNHLFYEGKVNEGAKELTKEVSLSINSDRCSIWLYNEDKSSIVCQQLYVKSEDTWYQDIELFEKDFKPYFDTLKKNSLIIADQAWIHEATSCFTELYLEPLGIKSMLDVPINFKGQMVGVICMENFAMRSWKQEEIDFAQMLSSLYTFAIYSKENFIQTNKLKEMERFINESTLISKADKFGNITYVNQKFTEVSGWSLEECRGKNHNIVNSGTHPIEFWRNMYKEVVEERKIWNQVVTNKTKDGKIYYVDSFIKAEFDSDTDELSGFTSIRQDVTQIIESINELDKKNTYLEYAAKILRHDMHSGINTYIPRGISSLQRKLTEDDLRNFKIEAPIKMIRDGLKHAQKVYKGVYEFTNLVKKDAQLNKSECNIKEILEDYLSTTSYKSQVILNDNLPTLFVNEPLFCTSIDNLIINGLKYNDSPTKLIEIYTEKDVYGNEFICVEDNGRGMTQEDFLQLSKPYVRRQFQKENGDGIGLNICLVILKEHGFTITSEKLEPVGTKLKIKVK